MERYDELDMGGFTYAEVGATRSGGRLPDGYRHLRHRMRVGHGRTAFECAAAAVLEWRMHAGMHVHPQASRPRAEPGATVTVFLTLGRWHLSAPCEIVWVVDEPRRKGFAYGTLQGHPERGEESFVVDWDERDVVWLTITAFSRAGRWYTKVAGPLAVLLQHVYALCCGAVVRGMVRRIVNRPARAHVNGSAEQGEVSGRADFTGGFKELRTPLAQRRPYTVLGVDGESDRGLGGRVVDEA